MRTAALEQMLASNQSQSASPTENSNTSHAQACANAVDADPGPGPGPATAPVSIPHMEMIDNLNSSSLNSSSLNSHSTGVHSPGDFNGWIWLDDFDPLADLGSISPRPQDTTGHSNGHGSGDNNGMVFGMAASDLDAAGSAVDIDIDIHSVSVRAPTLCMDVGEPSRVDSAAPGLGMLTDLQQLQQSDR